MLLQTRANRSNRRNWSHRTNRTNGRPAGATGETGPTGESCCCRASVLYALAVIKNYLKTNATVFTFNSEMSGAIGDFSTNGEVVKIGDKYISLCNILEITFDAEPDSSSIFNCTTEDCCCNGDLAAVLQSIVGNTFPATVNFEVEILDNEASIQTIEKVYGICKGILWAHVKGGGNEPNVAIPLCSIFSIKV